MREEETSWLEGYTSSMFKSSSDNRRMGYNVYFNSSVHVVGQASDGGLPNPHVIQTLLCTFYRRPYTCGMINENRVLRMCNRQNREVFRFDGPYREHTVRLMFRKRSVTSKATPDGYTRRSAAVKSA